MAIKKIKFGTDGWRAVIADDYTFENVRFCAQGWADYLKGRGDYQRGVVIGYDTRFA
jgi:phosphomannomutase